MAKLGNCEFRGNPLKNVTLSKNIETMSKPFGKVLDTLNTDGETAYLLGWYVDDTYFYYRMETISWTDLICKVELQAQNTMPY